MTLTSLLDAFLKDLPEASILAVTSKVVSLCENRVIPIGKSPREKLIKQESSLYLPSELSKYGHHFTIANDTLIASAGIDESNGNGNYVLWPSNPQESADRVRQYLVRRFNLTKVGVIITDSISIPLRRGTHGIALSHSGFIALKNYVGKLDLFGRPFEVSQANFVEGLAASAVLVMGEGTEQTPMALITELPFIEFNDNSPTAEELQGLHISIEEDLFAPFLKSVSWKNGDKSALPRGPEPK
jgi:F420-0:gamma-glutamyl ligase